MEVCHRTGDNRAYDRQGCYYEKGHRWVPDENLEKHFKEAGTSHTLFTVNIPRSVRKQDGEERH